MATLPEGYKEVPEADRKKAETFFAHARSVADTGNFDYSIELFFQGLERDPENVDAHKALRETSLKRKASGGKDLGMLAKMGLKRTSSDEKQNMLNAERLLAYDPGNKDVMKTLLEAAYRAGCYDTCMWIAPICIRANADSGKEDISIYLAVKDVYVKLGQWKHAVDAMNYAVALRPTDMDLQRELKDLGARQTMDEGKYGEAGSFRSSLRDVEAQEKLMEEDRDVRDVDAMTRLLRDAEAEYNAQPEELGKLSKYVDLLVKTESMEHENRALEILEAAHQRTRQFKFRLKIGEIRMRQLARMERSLREELARSPDDEELKKDLRKFVREKTEQELAEYLLAAEAYPTDMNWRFEAAKRMFMLGQFSESIPEFQRARQDPKLRTDAGLLLGRAFLEAGFVDEAVDTLKDLVDSYQIKGDSKHKEMTYWYGVSLQEKNETQAAIKCFSQVAQMDFNYKDVQARIKKLRSGA